MARSVPLLGDKGSIVMLCPVQELDMSDRDVVQGSIGSDESLEKSKKSGTVQVSRMSRTMTLMSGGATFNIYSQIRAEQMILAVLAMDCPS